MYSSPGQLWHWLDGSSMWRLYAQHQPLSDILNSSQILTCKHRDRTNMCFFRPFSGFRRSETRCSDPTCYSYLSNLTTTSTSEFGSHNPNSQPSLTTHLVLRNQLSTCCLTNQFTKRLRSVSHCPSLPGETTKDTRASQLLGFWYYKATVHA